MKVVQPTNTEQCYNIMCCIMYRHVLRCDNRFVIKPKGFKIIILIIDIQITVSLQCVLCTFDISILHQVSLLGKIDPPRAEYLSNFAPRRAGMLMDVEV